MQENLQENGPSEKQIAEFTKWAKKLKNWETVDMDGIKTTIKSHEIYNKTYIHLENSNKEISRVYDPNNKTISKFEIGNTQNSWVLNENELETELCRFKDNFHQLKRVEARTLKKLDTLLTTN